MSMPPHSGQFPALLFSRAGGTGAAVPSPPRYFSRTEAMASAQESSKHLSMKKDINLGVCQGILERRREGESWKRAGKDLEIQEGFCRYPDR